MAKIAADLCEQEGKQCLIVVDYYSCDIEVAPLTFTTSQQFSEKYNFKHTMSSPSFPQANGAAERSVAAAKHILWEPDPQLALMSYRATPITATGLSQDQLAIGQQIRTTVPILPIQLVPRPVDHNAVRRKDQQTKNAYSLFYNTGHSSRPLTVLELDQHQIRWRKRLEDFSKSRRSGTQAQVLLCANITRNSCLSEDTSRKCGMYRNRSQHQRLVPTAM